MSTGKRAVQLLSRSLGNAAERFGGASCRGIAIDDTCASSSGKGHQFHVHSCIKDATNSGIWERLGLGVGYTLRPRHRSFGLGGPQGWSAAQVRNLSWRRYVPSFGDLRNAAEAPNRQVTNLLLAINVATFILAKYDRSVAMSMALVPYHVAMGEWHRLLTCGFLHLDFLHLLANMLSVHWLGPGVESAAGRGRFAAIYLVSILGGSWAQYSFGSFTAASLGASGGVFGLFGAYLMFRLRNRNFISWDTGDSSWLLQVVGINVALGLLSGGSIAQMAHLGGALAGAGTCWLIGPRYRWMYGRVVDQPVLSLFRTRD
ncbi:RHOMBOID-like protein 10, chloroplastic [Pleodorina starrii]|uniref:RHOMBOID-like protein 10, chloroplastic n=1 Tax=Pleodorina starrii TaxID=330485 RepID=A0A9W6C062_9CHLO|nr:RHOMBOID-like protein 10, chloroplastic [Pleodorina starrii]GLC75868.1 RHOMBOID-like protein 10 [Pleodorina starrii]